MRKFLRFVFSDADQANINTGSILVLDMPYSASPAAGTPYPQTLQILFTMSGPTVHVVPLFPGALTFIPDPAAPGTTPKPSEVDPSNYSSWKTQGTLRIKLVDQKLMKEFLSLMIAVGPIPTTLWYGPVVITQDFLFTTLKTGLKKKKVISGGVEISPANTNWHKHAIARFLEGLYEPEVNLGATEADDDVVKFPMPEVFTPPGSVTILNLTVARTQKPQDANDALFDSSSGSVKRTDPVHHSHGVIPARHVYRTMRGQMLNAAAGKPVPDAVLVDWPNAPRYFPIRFTRTFKPVQNFSAYFPQSIAVIDSQAGANLATQRLPAHGVLFLTQLPASPTPNPPKIKVSLTPGSTMRLIDGATANVWRVKAGTAPLLYDLASSPQPHVVARRHMTDEIFSDVSRPSVRGPSCTYFSLRRADRALVDNRITGGRLVHDGAKTSDQTKQLLDEAFVGTPGASDVLLNGNPKPGADPHTSSPKFKKIWEALFPDPAPAQSIGGSTHRDVIYSKGLMFYSLWQVAKEEFEEGTKRNFADAHVGRGSAGAMVSVGLASGFLLDPVRQAGETDNAFFDRIVNLMITTLKPGCLLQFWVLNSDFEILKNRQLTGGTSLQSFGHSPTFSHFMPNDPATLKPKGIVVIDQMGNTECPIVTSGGVRHIEWSGAPIEIWCAAAWDE